MILPDRALIVRQKFGEQINGDRFTGTQIKNTAELMVPHRVNTIYKNEIINGDL